MLSIMLCIKAIKRKADLGEAITPIHLLPILLAIRGRRSERIRALVSVVYTLCVSGADEVRGGLGGALAQHGPLEVQRVREHGLAVLELLQHRPWKRRKKIGRAHV